MMKGGGIADSPPTMTPNKGDRFISSTDTRAALDALGRACLEWPPNVVADVVSQVLLEGQEPDATLARTTHQGLVRLIDQYRGDAHPFDVPPAWLTPPFIERISQRLRRRGP
jgi:hypothetical protein